MKKELSKLEKSVRHEEMQEMEKKRKNMCSHTRKGSMERDGSSSPIQAMTRAKIFMDQGERNEIQ
jgi:hypothetical protein